MSFTVGRELADLPPDEGFIILKENWRKIPGAAARQQILKEWYTKSHYPLHLRNDPRLLDVTDLGVHDSSAEVRRSALGYVSNVAFRDFPEDLQAYTEWYRANRGKPMAVVITESVRASWPRPRRPRGPSAQAFKIPRRAIYALGDVPEARQAAMDAGLPEVIERWVAAGSDRKASKERVETTVNGLFVLAQLPVSERYLQRVVVPLLIRTCPGTCG